jgi:hypothetical protein
MDIIVDIDGTIANAEHRLHHIQKSPKDWDAFFAACVDDEPINEVIDMVRAFRDGGLHRVVLCSGRSDQIKAETQAWLKSYRVGHDRLYMRTEGDHRPDEEVKAEMLAVMRAEGFNPVLAIDDRGTVCEMWKRLGLTVLVVNGTGGAF